MKRQRDVIRTTFIAGFRHGDFDQGIKQGVATIGESLIRAQRAGELTGKPAIRALGAPDEKASGASLLLRNQVRLTLAGARVVIAAAEEKARSLKLNVNIAVVDDGGHLLAFERMDGARPASGYTAITKATSAATLRQPTGPLGQPGSSPDPLFNLSIQNAASASGGKITTLFGGKPLVVEEQVIGAVGVGGGTGEQDSEIAGAGVSALLEQLGGGAPADGNGRKTQVTPGPLSTLGRCFRSSYGLTSFPRQRPASVRLKVQRCCGLPFNSSRSTSWGSRISRQK
jgi:glc operon protein GlcG